MVELREVGGDLCSSRGSESNNGGILGYDTCSKRLTTFGWYELQSSFVSKSLISATSHSIAPKTGTLITVIQEDVQFHKVPL
jgi:hypothetical protein